MNPNISKTVDEELEAKLHMRLLEQTDGNLNHLNRRLERFQHDVEQCRQMFQRDTLHFQQAIVAVSRSASRIAFFNTLLWIGIVASIVYLAGWGPPEIKNLFSKLKERTMAIPAVPVLAEQPAPAGSPSWKDAPPSEPVLGKSLPVVQPADPAEAPRVQASEPFSRSPVEMPKLPKIPELPMPMKAGGSGVAASAALPVPVAEEPVSPPKVEMPVIQKEQTAVKEEKKEKGQIHSVQATPGAADKALPTDHEAPSATPIKESPVDVRQPLAPRGPERNLVQPSDGNIRL